MRSFAVTPSVLVLFVANIGLAIETGHNQFRPLWRDEQRFSPRDVDVGELLYLTPYIESGDIASAKTLSEVTEPLDGIPTSEMPTSYSGFITVNGEKNSNTFFWFF